MSGGEVEAEVSARTGRKAAAPLPRAALGGLQATVGWDVTSSPVWTGAWHRAQGQEQARGVGGLSLGASSLTGTSLSPVGEAGDTRLSGGRVASIPRLWLLWSLSYKDKD